MDWVTMLSPFGLLLAGGVGYVLRRQLEGRPVEEGLDKRLKAVTLKKAMDDAGLDAGDLDALTEELLGKTQRVRKREDEVVAGLSAAANPAEPMTQLEMNNAQQNRAQEAALVLDRVNVEFADHLERDDAARLVKAMKAWETFVESHAEIARSMFRGGSMEPLAYWAERERMTVTRIAELQELIAQRRALEAE